MLNVITTGENKMKKNPRDMDWKDFVHADHLTSLRDDDDSDDDDDDGDDDVAPFDNFHPINATKISPRWADGSKRTNWNI